MLKNILSLLFAAFACIALSVNAAAAKLSALPLSDWDDCGYQSLEKNVTLKTDLVIDENEILVIPNGKRLKLTDEKTVTLNGKLYIENGGSLVIESGELLLVEEAAVFSNGKISVKSGGKVSVSENASLIVSPTGSLSLKGEMYRSLYADCVACFGKYSGSGQGIKTEIISAVSFSRTDFYNSVYEDFKTYSADEAKKLFPDIGIDSSQENPSGGMLSAIRFFCGNGQTVELLIHGELDGKRGIVSGINVNVG